MNQTRKILSDAGKRGVIERKRKKAKLRHELFTELSGLVKDKAVLNYIQFAEPEWDNSMLQDLLDSYRNEK